MSAEARWGLVRGGLGRPLAIVLFLAARSGFAAANPESQAVCAALPGPAPGSGPPPAGSGPSPQAMLRSAAEAYEANRYDQALALLRDAYARTRLPDTLFNMAQTCRAAGQLAEAQRLYELALATEPEPSLREDAERRLAQLRTRAGLGNAYRLPPAARLLFRVGEVERLLGQRAQAATGSGRFPAQDQDGGQRPSAAQRPRELIGPPAVPRRSVGRPLVRRWWFWTTVAAVVTAAVVPAVVATQLTIAPSYQDLRTVRFSTGGH